MNEGAATPLKPSQARWSNWFANETCWPQRLERPETEGEVQELVAWAAQRGLTVRVAGSGHSVTPVVETDGLLLDLSRLAGGVRVDAQRRTATIAPGLKLKQVFDPLWEQGFAMRNVGEVASATLAGAVSTGVHGTGLGLQSISGAVTAMRLVTADGETIEVSAEQTPELLRAAQVSLGMLGVITQLTLAVEPGYYLREHAPFMSVDETVALWDDMLRAHRHFSFYYLPNPTATGVFDKQIPSLPDQVGEICWILMRDPATSAQQPEDLGVDERHDRWDRILTFDFTGDFREIEFAVPLEAAKRTFAALRQLIRERYPDVGCPVDVRFTAPDEAMLSPYHEGPKAVFSVSARPTENWAPLLRDTEDLFVSQGGLPHWGKLHTMTPARLQTMIPASQRFREIRRELDPGGVFMNRFLEPLFQ